MKSLEKVLWESYQQFPSLSKRDIQELLAYILKISKEDFFFSLDQEILPYQLENMQTLLKERLLGKPLAYILGYVDFYDCKIFVDSHVLIPRVETEILLDKVLAEVKSRPTQVVFDICCGSGCLGIGFKKQKKTASVYLSDISAQALEIARNNAKVNEVEVSCLLGDLLEPFKGLPKADLILCNPPYISDKEYLTLETSVKDFEPRLALTSGPTGYEIFERLAAEAYNYLNPRALVVLEIGSSQRQEVIHIFSKGPWKLLRSDQDYAQLDRFIFLEVE
jgi:release factor glutamine methyltransferase